MCVLGVLYRKNRPKSGNLASLTPHSSATIRRKEKLTDLGNSLVPCTTTWSKQYLSVVHICCGTFDFCWCSWVWFITSASLVLSRFTSSSTCQPISLIIPALIIHHWVRCLFLCRFRDGTPNYVLWPNLVKIGRCEVAERSSGLPQKSRAPRDSSHPHFAKNGPIVPKIPGTLSPLDMSTYTEFGSDWLRFAGLIPERLTFWPQK